MDNRSLNTIDGLVFDGEGGNNLLLNPFSLEHLDTLGTGISESDDDEVVGFTSVVSLVEPEVVV